VKEIQKYRASTTFVPAEPQRRELTTVHPIEVANLLPPSALTGHARSDDSAISNATATLMVSGAYVIAAAMVTAGLLLVVWLFRGLGDGWAAYTFTGLIAWGVAILVALWGNRKQSLHHSPSGISHHEIDSREKIALHAVDVHAKLLMAKWEIDNDR
jgi:hypothetical protein